ncbi:MAG: methylmalonyl-CoA decarboxylase subunit alpha [Chloroflexota bacterium]|nr:methylmalonyl-CoA decarboxylase subunit alpha [Chloroflexota bacterium]
MAGSRAEYDAALVRLEAEARTGDAREAERLHAAGKRTARERIDFLLDPGSFVEEFMLAETQATDFGMAERRRPTDGIVLGSGAVDGRLIYVFAQDRTILQGGVGSAHGEKIAYALETATRLGVPIVGLYDSVGARIQEGLDVTRAVGRIFAAATQASGAVPQISAIMGPCVGVAAYTPMLGDFVVMVEGSGQMFVSNPTSIRQATGVDVSVEELGGAMVHAEMTGVADLVVPDDASCLQAIRKLLSFLPASHAAVPPPTTPAEPNASVDLARVVPDQIGEPYDVHEVICGLVDGGELMELKARFATNLIVGLARLDGQVVGLVANQPAVRGGALDAQGATKAAGFIRFCDAFGVPLISLVDTAGFVPSVEQEHGGIVRAVARMFFSYAEATVPKIAVYLGRGYGGAKQAMATREMGADQLFLWPGVELAIMEAESAVSILYRREIESAADPAEARRERVAEFNARYAGPFDALAKQFAHAAIRPEETRERLIRALRLLVGKQVVRPPKKRSLLPI